MHDGKQGFRPGQAADVGCQNAVFHLDGSLGKPARTAKDSDSIDFGLASAFAEVNAEI
jgi:hypothetical protein